MGNYIKDVIADKVRDEMRIGSLTDEYMAEKIKRINDEEKFVDNTIRQMEIIEKSIKN